MTSPSNRAANEARSAFNVLHQLSEARLPQPARPTITRNPPPFKIYEDPATPERTSAIAQSNLSSTSSESPPSLTGRGSVTPPAKKRSFDAAELIAGVNTKRVCRPKTANERRVDGFPLEARAWIAIDPTKIAEKEKLERSDLGPRFISPAPSLFPETITIRELPQLSTAQQAALEDLNSLDDAELLSIASNPTGTGYGIGFQNSILINRFDQNGNKSVKDIKLSDFSIHSLSWISDQTMIVGNEKNHFIKLELAESDDQEPVISNFLFSGDGVTNQKLFFATDQEQKQIAVVAYRPKNKQISVDLLTANSNPRQELDSKIVVEFVSQEEPTKVYFENNYITIATPEYTYVLKLTPSQDGIKSLVSLNREGKHKYSVTETNPTRVWHRSNNPENQ